MIIEVTDIRAKELEIYAQLNEAQLLHYFEPHPGIFTGYLEIVKYLRNVGQIRIRFKPEQRPNGGINYGYFAIIEQPPAKYFRIAGKRFVNFAVTARFIVPHTRRKAKGTNRTRNFAPTLANRVQIYIRGQGQNARHLGGVLGGVMNARKGIPGACNVLFHNSKI